MVNKLPYRRLLSPPLPYILALILTLGIFGLHMLPNMDSMLNENNTEVSHVFLKSQIDYHKEIAPFARRPLTTFLIESTSNLLAVKFGHAFILVNFSLLFLSGVLVFRLSKILKADHKQALVNMLFYFLSFSILFAFFPPVFTYDEPLQYCFVILALTAFVNQKWRWYIPLFALALITRETSMLLLPGLALFLPGIQNRPKKFLGKEHLQIIVPVLLPVLFYTLFIGIFIWKYNLLEATQLEMASRFSCFLENFENTKNTVESVTSFFLTLGPFLYLTYITIKKKGETTFGKYFIRAFLVTVSINTPIVVLTAFARESRLFALPLLFIWPIFMQLFRPELDLLFCFRLYSYLFKKWQFLLSFIILNILNYWFCFEVYKDLGLGENTYFASYLFAMNLGVILHFLLSNFRKNLGLQ